MQFPSINQYVSLINMKVRSVVVRTLRRTVKEEGKTKTVTYRFKVISGSGVRAGDGEFTSGDDNRHIRPRYRTYKSGFNVPLFVVGLDHEGTPFESKTGHKHWTPGLTFTFTYEGDVNSNFPEGDHFILTGLRYEQWPDPFESRYTCARISGIWIDAREHSRDLSPVREPLDTAIGTGRDNPITMNISLVYALLRQLSYGSDRDAPIVVFDTEREARVALINMARLLVDAGNRTSTVKHIARCQYPPATQSSKMS